MIMGQRGRIPLPFVRAANWMLEIVSSEVSSAAANSR
jgi:hypothetical protein